MSTQATARYAHLAKTPAEAEFITLLMSGKMNTLPPPEMMGLVIGMLGIAELSDY